MEKSPQRPSKTVLHKNPSNPVPVISRDQINLYIGMVIPLLIGKLFFGYINPYILLAWWPSPIIWKIWEFRPQHRSIPVHFHLEQGRDHRIDDLVPKDLKRRGPVREDVQRVCTTRELCVKRFNGATKRNKNTHINDWHEPWNPGWLVKVPRSLYFMG